MLPASRTTPSFASLVLCIIIILVISVNAQTPLKVNDMAPAMNLRDIQGKMVFSKNILKQKPILVSFFFTACKPCKKELPELEKLHARYGSRVQMFLVATDAEGTDAVQPYVEKMGLTMDVLIDKYSDAVKLFGVTKYPSLYVIGKNGRVIYACEGYSEGNMAAVEGVLAKLK